VSWHLHLLPLQEAVRDGGLAWAASADSPRGLPYHVPGPQPSARVLDVLGAFRAAGCHGRAWFEVRHLDPGLGLPQCPDPITCAGTGGLDLGEVSLHVAGQAGGEHPLQADDAVEGVSFRKPSGAAALHAACALTAVTGPLLVYEPSANQVFVVWPDEQAEDDAPPSHAG
jgi:hypothetical protein